jgi:hypothetical protein
MQVGPITAAGFTSRLVPFHSVRSIDLTLAYYDPLLPSFVAALLPFVPALLPFAVRKYLTFRCQNPPYVRRPMQIAFRLT